MARGFELLTRALSLKLLFNLYHPFISVLAGILVFQQMECSLPGWMGKLEAELASCLLNDSLPAVSAQLSALSFHLLEKMGLVF
jgi:hypothetical protein